MNNKKGGNLSWYWALNKTKHVIERISLEEFDKNPDNYLTLGEYQAKILAKINTQYIIKAIEENGVDKYYNVGLEPIEHIKDDYMNKESWLGSNLYHNPKGLWFGCGADWQNYIDSPSQWAFSTHLYEIYLAPSVKKINSVKELKEFISKYKNDESNLTITNILNWDKIKEDYDGMVICPYLGNEIWGEDANQMSLKGAPEAIQSYVEKIDGASWKSNIIFTAEWYRHWETGSGVVWKASGIKDYKLVKKLGSFNIKKKMEKST